MTIQAEAPDFEKSYPRRGDRLHEEPSAKNAQGLFPPDACIFVGNLSTKVGPDDLAEDLKEVFTQFGPCHVKIKQDKKKGLPGAFVQFEKVDDASAALASTERVVLHDRWLRIERAKGRRTACLGLRSGASITPQDISLALDGRGPLEAYCIESYLIRPQTWASIGKVTFAYVDDCRDAIKFFQKNDRYYLSLLDMDGSPMLSDSSRNNQRTRGESSSRTVDNRRYSSHHHNLRLPRNTSNRRGSSRNWAWKGSWNMQQQQHPQQQQQHPQQVSMPSPHLQANFPTSFWMNDIRCNNEGYQPVCMSSHLPPLNNGYSGPSFMFNVQPRFDHAPPFSEPYLSHNPGGPFIINSQPPYNGSLPTFYPGPPLIHEALVSPCDDTGLQAGYSNLHVLAETCPPKPRYPKPSHQEHKIATQSKDMEKVKEIVKDEATIERLLELKKPENPPKLIRIYEPNKNGREARNSSVDASKTDTAGSLTAVQNPVKEGQHKEVGLERELEDGNETQTSTELTSDSTQTSDSDQSYNNTQATYLLVDEGSTTTGTSRSRSLSC